MAGLTDELQSLKDLLDQGVLTQEEFDAQKEQLLTRACQADSPAVTPAEPVSAPASTDDSGSFGWAVLGFIIPLVGLILYCTWNKTKPKCASRAGVGALVGFVLGVIGTILRYL